MNLYVPNEIIGKKNLPDDDQPFARNHGAEGVSSIHHVGH